MSIEAPELVNGQLRTEPDPVKFGPRPTQVLHPEVASKMLTGLKEKHPAIFGALLCDALDIELSKRGRQ